VRAIERGAAEHLARYGAAIVGGNIASTDGPLVCDMTLLGTCKRGRAWKRQAKAGDTIVVAGRLGEAAAGVAILKRGVRDAALVRSYKRPTPRIKVARALSSNASVHGAIDISDGLSSDLIHMCEASRLGCEIDAGALPIPRAVRAFCAAGRRNAVEWALHAGEDYALVLSVAPQRAEAVCRIIRNSGAPASIIGCFTSSRGTYGILENGRVRAFRPRGWDHLQR
jgi:thiamine-monophosphate kinase